MMSGTATVASFAGWWREVRTEEKGRVRVMDFVVGQVAIVGTREPSPAQQDLCVRISRAFRDLGMELVTGAAQGIDALAASVWNEVCPERVTLVLPWAGYNQDVLVAGNRVLVYSDQKEWADSVREFHPAPERLRAGAFKLHARNYGIVSLADFVIAFPKDGKVVGGTGQTIRVARALGKRTFVLPGDLENLRSFYCLLRSW